jgi:hypothetical protein
MFFCVVFFLVHDLEDKIFVFIVGIVSFSKIKFSKKD